MNRRQIISVCLTALIALLVLVGLQIVTLGVDALDREWPPRKHSDIAMADEQMFDVLDEIPLNAPAKETAAPVHNPEPAKNQSNPAPASGHDVADRGKAADAPATVTSRQPAPVKAQTKPATPTGPSKEELERQRREEEARRRATATTASAFNRSTGANNTANTGKTQGNSGSPSGTSASVNGTGTGTVGGGWVIPSYARVPSTTTGSIKIKVRIDRSGRVTSLDFQGGNPPAATNAALRAAVEREIRSRRFTRANAADAPEQATAYITYTFR